jgi:hypothetical protein
MKIAITISTSVKPRRCRIPEFYDAPAKSQSGTGTWEDLRNSCPRNTRNDTKIIKKRRSLLDCGGSRSATPLCSERARRDRPPNPQTCASKHEMQWKAELCDAISEDRMTSEPLPRKAPSRFALPAHSKNFPLLAATRVVLAVPCFPHAVFPFRVFRACRGPIPRQRAAKKWQRSDSAPKLTMLGLLHAWRPCTQSLPPN